MVWGLRSWTPYLHVHVATIILSGILRGFFEAKMVQMVKCYKRKKSTSLFKEISNDLENKKGTEVEILKNQAFLGLGWDQPGFSSLSPWNQLYTKHKAALPTQRPVSSNFRKGIAKGQTDQVQKNWSVFPWCPAGSSKPDERKMKLGGTGRNSMAKQQSLWDPNVVSGFPN